jgi:uncharacterized membrane protein YfcA
VQDFGLYVIVGFCAQLVDGTLGMAYGLSATSLLLSFGVPPAPASATVHAAEVFTTGASAISHRYFGNIDKALFKRLVLPGIVGAVLGAYLLSSLPGDTIRPLVSVYLALMGVIIIVKAFRTFPPRELTRHVSPLGFIGAFVDAIGGGGWGPIVASTLIARGGDARQVVGTVNAAEFFVTLAASITFLFALQHEYWRIVLGLAVGGVVAAPLAGYLCKRAPIRPLMILVGLVIIGLSLRAFLH